MPEIPVVRVVSLEVRDWERVKAAYAALYKIPAYDQFNLPDPNPGNVQPGDPMFTEDEWVEEKLMEQIRSVTYRGEFCRKRDEIPMEIPPVDDIVKLKKAQSVPLGP